MTGTPRLAIVGDFDPTLPPHRATNDAVAHTASAAGLDVAVTWVPTLDLAVDMAPEAVLGGCDGIWIAPCSPYRSLDGAVAAVRYARERGVPLLGT